MKKLLVFFASIIITASLFAADNDEKLLSIIYTNDSHGMAWQFDEVGNPGIGGLAAQKTLVDKIRAEVQGKGGSVILLSGGDITMGDPRSNICMNKPYLKGMSLGNHEFDFGIDAFYEMKKETDFPFISGNIYKDGGTKAVADEYIEKTYDNGLKVAVLGLTTRETEQITSIGLEGKLVMTDPMQEAKTRVPLLKKKNDIVIVLSHLGFYNTDKSFDGYYGDNYLAKEVPGIDVIVGGHNQVHLKTPVKIGDTYIVQTGGFGKWVGRLDVYLKGKTIVKTSHTMYPVNLKKKVVKDGKVAYEFEDKEIKENPAMIEMLNRFKCDFSVDKITTLPFDLEGKRELVRYEESALGNLIADVMKEKAKADISFFNAGSIRQGLKKGDITERDVYNVFPFSDTLVLGKMKGDQLQEVLDYFAEKGEGHGGFLQVSGVSTKLYKGAALEIMVNGAPLDKNKVYSFAINSFLAEGGDGYTMVRDIRDKKMTGYSIPAILVDYLKKNKNLKKPNGKRITIVK